MGTRRPWTQVALAGWLLAAIGCAGRNTFVHTRNFDGRIAGLFIGIWHGAIAPISLLASLALDVNIYEVHNTGFPYNLGFLAGLALWPYAAWRRWQWRASSPVGPSKSSTS